jgi:uncharacterized protein YndB with AHSA1/START domain
MSTIQRSVAHASFSIERDLPVPPARAFLAFSDPAEKAAWFGGDGWETTEAALDFRVGGREVDEGVFHGQTVSRFEAVYTDIVENERIVLAYDMWIDGTHISTSVASYEFLPTADGTRYVHTEHGIHLDGFDDGSMREEGTRGILDQLVAHLSPPS